MWVLTFFQQKYCVYAIFNDQSLNHKLINDIVSFEQLGPDWELCMTLRKKEIFVI